MGVEFRPPTRLAMERVGLARPMRCFGQVRRPRRSISIRPDFNPALVGRPRGQGRSVTALLTAGLTTAFFGVGRQHQRSISIHRALRRLMRQELAAIKKLARDTEPQQGTEITPSCGQDRRLQWSTLTPRDSYGVRPGLRRELRSLDGPGTTHPLLTSMHSFGRERRDRVLICIAFYRQTTPHRSLSPSTERREIS